MRRMTIKCIIIIAICMVTVLQINTACANSNFNQVLAAMKNDYPEGMTWTNNNSAGQTWWSVGCWAFANIFGERLFGSIPARDWGYHTDRSRIVVGDVISTDYANSSGETVYGHTMVVIGINGDTLTIAEGNGEGGKIHYGRTIGRYAYALRVYHAPNYDSVMKSSVFNQSLDLITCSAPNTLRVGGWVYNKENSSASIQVHVYIDGPAGSGTILGGVNANLSSDDVNQAFGITGKHRFDYTFTNVPGGYHKFYFYAVDGNKNDTLGTDNERGVFIDFKGADPVIPDGDYLIVSAATTDKGSFYYLDILGTEVNSQTNVQLHGPSNGNISAFEAWTVKYNSTDKFYTISQKTNNNMCLDVQNGDSNSDIQITVAVANNSAAQKWTIEKNSAYGYMLLPKCGASTPMCMDLMNGSVVDGGRIRTWPKNNSVAQSWLFIPYIPVQPIDEGRYIMLYNADKAYEIDIPGDTGDVTDHTDVQLWQDSAQSQFNSFDLIKLDNGYYKIRHAASGKCLDVTNGLSTFATNVALYSDNGALAQQWAIMENGTGYNLISRCNGYYLDLPSGNTKNGQTIESYPWMNNNNQRWNFTAAENKIHFIADEADSGVPDEQIKYYKSDAIIPDQIPTREHYNFVCWTDPSTLTAENQPTLYYPGDIITEDRNFDLYALWEEADDSIIARGTCGENITWVLDNTGKLSISGIGAMQGDHAWSYGWKEYKDQIKSIEIKNGITSIGNWAFWSERNLTSVIIPTSVTAIGDYAFDQCYSLPSIQLPDTIISIGDCAFRYCSVLSSVNLPRDLMSIGDFVFMSYPEVVVITIPTDIQMKQHIRMYDGILCSLSLPATITEIGIGSFLCTSIPVETNINPDFILPESLCTIESDAFSGISATYVFLPENRDGKTIIGDRAFANCKHLQYIQISDCTEIEISDSAFSDCNSNLTIIDDAESVGDTIYDYSVDHGINWICNEYYAGDG